MVVKGGSIPPNASDFLTTIFKPKFYKMANYTYWKVIQQNYGQGWEDVSHYEANSKGYAKDYKLLFHDLKEYRFMGYSTRVIFRKEKVNTNVNA
jgi:hypothetical protein